MKGGGRLNGIEFQLEVDSLAGADGQLEFLARLGAEGLFDPKLYLPMGIERNSNGPTSLLLPCDACGRQRDAGCVVHGFKDCSGVELTEEAAQHSREGAAPNENRDLCIATKNANKPCRAN